METICEAEVTIKKRGVTQTLPGRFYVTDAGELVVELEEGGQVSVRKVEIKKARGETRRLPGLPSTLAGMARWRRFGADRGSLF